jgi:chromosome segregation ATPase
MELVTCSGDTSRRLREGDKGKALIRRDSEGKKMAVKYDAQSLKLQLTDSTLMTCKMVFLLLICQEITNEREALVVFSGRTRAEKERLKSEAMKIKPQCSKATHVQKQLKALSDECRDLTEEMDSLKLRERRSEVNCKSLKKAVHDGKVDMQELRAQFKQFALQEEALSIMKQELEYITRQRNANMVRAQRKADRRDTIRFEIDSLNLEIESIETKIKDAAQLEEPIRSEELDCEKLEREKDDLKPKVRPTVAERESKKRKTDALQHEKDRLLAQCSKLALLENELKNKKQQCETIKEEKKAFLSNLHCMTEGRDAIRKERDALKLAAADLRARRNEYAHWARGNKSRKNSGQLLEGRKRLFSSRIQYTKTDRGATQADREASQADREATEADREATEADREATQAERGVTRAGKRVTQVDRGTTQADREALQADREATEADREATEADIEVTQADREATEADREETQADRGATQADREATEADREATGADREATQADLYHVETLEGRKELRVSS